MKRGAKSEERKGSRNDNRSSLFAPRTSPRLLLTCEHAGNRVPPEFADVFREHRSLLATHRGHDIGALPLARAMARLTGAPLLHHDVTRLLVESNRSVGHPRLFSEITRELPDRQGILDRYYHPHRNRVTARVADWIAAGDVVIHVGVHTFTPVLDGETRHADVGLLYDPRRKLEKRFCRDWRDRITGLRVRMNYPYRGASDGLTTALRRQFSASRYLGIELEVNQGLFVSKNRWADALVNTIAAALASVAEPRRGRRGWERKARTHSIR